MLSISGLILDDVMNGPKANTQVQTHVKSCLINHFKFAAKALVTPGNYKT